LEGRYREALPTISAAGFDACVALHSALWASEAEAEASQVICPSASTARLVLGGALTDVGSGIVVGTRNASCPEQTRAIDGAGPGDAKGGSLHDGERAGQHGDERGSLGSDAGARLRADDIASPRGCEGVGLGSDAGACLRVDDVARLRGDDDASMHADDRARLSGEEGACLPVKGAGLHSENDAAPAGVPSSDACSLRGSADASSSEEPVACAGIGSRVELARSGTVGGADVHGGMADARGDEIFDAPCDTAATLPRIEAVAFAGPAAGALDARTGGHSLRAPLTPTSPLRSLETPLPSPRNEPSGFPALRASSKVAPVRSPSFEDAPPVCVLAALPALARTSAVPAGTPSRASRAQRPIVGGSGRAWWCFRSSPPASP